MVPIRDRLPALAALAIPVSAGAAWMAAGGAPAHYPLVNLGALALACLWALVGRGPHTRMSRHLLWIVLIVVMLSPLAIGPRAISITGESVARWVPIGPINLHTGMLAAPALCMLAARNRVMAPWMLLSGMVAVTVQPDAATGFALTFAAAGLYHVTKDWRVGLVTVPGFLGAIYAALHGELPPQPFVERLLIEAAAQSAAWSVALAAALLAGFLLILYATPFDRAKRFALGGALFGFVAMAVMSHYPYPLIGYGAAPILGFGLALGLHRIPLR